MQVVATNFTIAEYCGQIAAGTIVVNKDYQRTDTVWPPAARSYLIETILEGYPMPKFILSQKTDLKSRKTIKEIVDGQQRTKAITDFFGDRLRISGKSRFSGKTLKQLEEDDQQHFINYSITADVFAGATDDEIRQVFRRMNSYTVPLNHQEKRHATHQGDFKWFIIDMTQQYAGVLKTMGVFPERQLSRMADASLFSEIVMAVLQGIETASQSKLNKFYDDRDETFPEEADIRKRLQDALNYLISWDQLHNGNVMKPFQVYSFLLALTHCLKPTSALASVFQTSPQRQFKEDVVLSNLGKLAAALDNEEPPRSLASFVTASSSATNTKTNRERRFQIFCKALQPTLLV